jgi:hypothetical protein
VGAVGAEPSQVGGNGSGGRCVVRYPGTQRATGGTITTANVGGVDYTCHEFTSTGTFTYTG